MNLLQQFKLLVLLLVYLVSVQLNRVAADNYGSTNIAFKTRSGRVIARWVSVSSSRGGNVLQKLPEPAGLEESIPIYVCRGKANGNRNKPGKLWISKGKYACIIPEWGEVHRQDFDLLDAPEGATSWVPKTYGPPTNPIVAGTHPAGGTAYICRAWNGGALLVGTLDEDRCYVPRGGKENFVTYNVEVLVINAYGLAI